MQVKGVLYKKNYIFYLAIMGCYLLSCATKVKKPAKSAQIIPVSTSSSVATSSNDEDKISQSGTGTTGSTQPHQENLVPQPIQPGPNRPQLETTPPAQSSSPWIRYDRKSPPAALTQETFQHPTQEKIREDLQKAPTIKQGQRPRIFIQKKEFDRVVQLIKAKEPFLSNVEKSFRKRADDILDRKLAPFELDGRGVLSFVHTNQESIAILALMYRLSGERKYGSKAVEYMEHMSQFPHWNHEKHFLDVGIASYIMGITFDWTYELLDKEQKKRIAEAIFEKAIVPGLAQIERRAFWFQDQNNWNPICSGGLTIAALSIFGEDPQWSERLVQVITKSLSSLPFYLKSLEPDGASVEGILYWHYGMANLIRALETINGVFGTDYGLSSQRALGLSGYYPLALSGPVAGVTLGDDSLKVSPSDTFFWFAHRYQKAELARYRLNLLEKSGLGSSIVPDNLWWDFFFYHPSHINPRPASQQEIFDHYLRGVEFVSFRSDPRNPKGMFIGITNNANDASHAHLACGSFFIQGEGKVWALGGLGSEDYQYPGYFAPTQPNYLDQPYAIQKPGRFHMYRLRAEGKNTLVINPDHRPDQNPRGKPVIEKIFTQPESAMMVTDLSSCFDRDASLVKRGVRLVQKRSMIQILDTVKPLKAARIVWSMHTPAHISLIQEGKAAVLIQGHERFWVQSHHPTARFTVSKAQYLDNRTFPLSRNSTVRYANLEVKKLMLEIQSEGLTETSIAVSMSPLKGGAQTLDLPKPAPLETW